MQVIQFCNVGNVVGGTAACAWSVTKAMPDVEHTVVFRSSPSDETRSAFSHCQIEVAKNIEQDSLQRWGGDFLILHNISSANVFWGQQKPSLKIPVIQYAHSAMRAHAGATLSISCSRYLSQKLNSKPSQVVYQGVPCPKKLSGHLEERTSFEDFVVGRICTPVLRKWTERQVPFYQKLADQFPKVRWEFVGCPVSMRSQFAQACQQRVTFHEASWNAREHLNRWHVLLYHHSEVEETFGRTVAEAMRAGCVPVVDCAGGFREQIGSQDGYLCAKSNDFSDALDELSSFEIWRERSVRSIQSAEARFSLSSFRQRILDVLLLSLEIHS